MSLGKWAAGYELSMRHVARLSTLIFERKELCFFIKYSVQLMFNFKTCAFGILDVKESFESGRARSCEQVSLLFKAFHSFS